ncbi:MAG: protein translocase subunit SecF, partial [Proteobacteria bacterium]|nr:protein translocase subunit SecF [Pseudomonadota bacterium]
MRLLKLVPDNTNIHFLKWRVPFFVVSIILIVASWGLILTQGLNLGVDFIGGQMIRVTFTQSTEAPVAKLRTEVEKLGFGEPTIQRFGQPNQVSIRMKLPHGSESDPGKSEAMAKTITAAIKQAHADARVDGVDSVSGKVSGELFHTGMLALGLAMVAISIYIWVRFEWQFGVGALFSLFHDVSLTLGMFA